ncbi:AaceriABR221Cp [[Ashbya] aceris (nom. inval.)]|nr:AaceriABR221Cp [[Ashbya] aceris (nom. inval.)]
MAGKADKKQAAANTAALRRLYTYVVPAVILSVLRQLVFGDASVARYVLWHIPLAGALYTLERSGRPHYDGGRLARVGVSLDASSGLTGALFDVVYTSVACDAVAAALGTTAQWWLLFAWPVYWAYSGWRMLRPART